MIEIATSIVVGFVLGIIYMKLHFSFAGSEDSDRIDYLYVTDSSLVVSDKGGWAVVKDREVVGSPSGDIRVAIDSAAKVANGRG